MQVTRPPAVAGSFYPGRARHLSTTVDDLLQTARTEPRDPAPAPKALIVPHAGYLYSGPTAARGYVRLDPIAHRIRRVVLLGPVHRVPIHGLALPDADALATPLGEVPLDTDLSALDGLPQVGVHEAAHRHEHSLEVHLPFLQRLLTDFTVVPLLVGNAAPDQVAEVIEALWGGPETVIVVSSDLSHYHPYEVARRLDTATIDEVLRLGGPLVSAQACGAAPANGLLHLARHRHLVSHLVDLCNSGDTAGDRAGVVGYASVAFAEPAPAGSKEAA